MGTRSGDVDPQVILYIMGKEGLTLSEMNTLLNKHSGLIGVSGESSDMREVITSMKEGNKRSKYAYDIFVYRIKKYIGAYIAAMGGCDAVVFTGGVGENSVDVRKSVCENMEFLGMDLDEERSEKKEILISKDGSRIKIFRIPTNEELVIALDTEKIVSELNAAK